MCPVWRMTHIVTTNTFCNDTCVTGPASAALARGKYRRTYISNDSTLLFLKHLQQQEKGWPEKSELWSKGQSYYRLIRVDDLCFVRLSDSCT